MIWNKGLMLLAAVALGAAFAAAPAEAKCSKDCKDTIKQAFKDCKTACATLETGKDKRNCKKIFCKPAKKSHLGKCKAAESPTPPSCGSPSGAFVDPALE
jgi:hypothetical protein